MGYKQIRNTPPNATDLKRFKTVLLAKRREILGNVVSMENETLRRLNTDLSSQPYHMADLGTDTFEIENTLGLVGSERNILLEIESALERIQNGTYGVCEGNGELIPRPRLRAIPWTRYCTNCASLNERGLLFRESVRDKANDVADDDQIETDESELYE